MFRFWSTDSRGSDKTVEGAHLLSDCTKPVPNVGNVGANTLAADRPLKRRRLSVGDTSTLISTANRPLPTKRPRAEHYGGLPSPTSASADGEEEMISDNLPKAVDLDRVKETIQYQFGLEILLKHDELRLIDQELAKCQIALEQLRRCHLIPYPVNCPTPEQMLNISSGKGPALQPRSGKDVPKWAPPFGVVEGPYARHYAKWLIPDPMFDGMQPEMHNSAEASRVRTTLLEGRTTRNSLAEVGSGKRPGRGVAGQKLQALSSGYPQPKDKQTPCILKRSDGQTVKLVCIDCHRWDFSSTQGFINHCRIAHRRDFKSHEEAAVHCGHPIEADEVGGVVGDDKPPASSSAASGLVHPFARDESLADQQTLASLRCRVKEALELYEATKRSGVRPPPEHTPSAPQAIPEFVGSAVTPHLSQLMRKKKCTGNLSEHVEDAKTKVDLDEYMSPGDDPDDEESGNLDGSAGSKKAATGTARTPAVMRVPVRADVPSPAPASVPRPASSKTHAPAQAESSGSADPETPSDILQRNEVETPLFDDDMDVELSPNTIASNNAPSLVSDDGEYDESDDGSSSEANESMEADSVSDVAEINIEDHYQDQDNTPRPIHHRGSHGAAVKLKKEEAKHVTFVTPIPSANGKGRRKQNLDRVVK